MSTGMTFVEDGNDDAGFTVKIVNGCRLVFGNIPLDAFEMLGSGYGGKAMVAADIADRIGATLVVGLAEDLLELRAMRLPISKKRESEGCAAERKGLPLVAHWLREGDRGASSNAMCKRFYGMPETADASHPHDPDDLGRCLAFLEATQSHPMLDRMVSVSPEWAALVSIWGELVECFESEKTSGACPRTFALMRKARGVA